MQQYTPVRLQAVEKDTVFNSTQPRVRAFQSSSKLLQVEVEFAVFETTQVSM